MRCVFQVLCALLLSGIAATAADNEIRVTASGTAAMNTSALLKRVVVEAQKQGVRKYLLKQSPDLDARLLDEALSDFASFVENWDMDDAEWEQFDPQQGQLTVTGVVEVDAEELNQWLESKGVSRNTFTDRAGNEHRIQLVILEEPPAVGAMKMNEFFGTDVTGAKWFFMNYTMFQRKVRDAINKKVAEMGFDVSEPAENRIFAKYKSPDGTLFGVHFDAEKSEFTAERDLLEAIRDNLPDALVLFYRIDTLAMDPGAGEVRSSVAFSVKNLGSGTTKAFGDSTAALPHSPSTGRDVAMDNLARATTMAMNKLLNAEDAAAKLNHIAISLQNAANRPKGPMKLVVNSAVFEESARRKTLFKLKKALVDQGLATKEGVKSTETTLMATISKEGIEDLDSLQFEYLEDLFSGLELELDESVWHIDAANNTITIAP